MEDHQKERRKRNSELFRMKINTSKSLHNSKISTTFVKEKTKVYERIN